MGIEGALQEGISKPFVWKVEQGAKLNYERLGEWLAGSPDLFRNKTHGLGLMQVLSDATTRLIAKPYRYHLYFRCPSEPTKAKHTPWHPKLEFRGRGGIIIAPPSLHPSGGRYAWADGRSPSDVPLTLPPSAVIAALPQHSANGAVRVPSVVPGVHLELPFTVSPNTRAFLAGQHSDGPEWNKRLFRAACDLAGRDVPQEDAEPLLLAGASPWNDTERDAAIRTIRSAYSTKREPGYT